MSRVLLRWRGLPETKPAPRLRLRASPLLRCVWCHDSVLGPATTCRQCGVLAHPECVLELRRCPTLACSGTLVRPRVPRPRRPWTWPRIESRFARCLALSLLLGPLAIVGPTGALILRDRWASRANPPPLLCWVNNDGGRLSHEVRNLKDPIGNLDDRRSWTFRVLRDGFTVQARDRAGELRWAHDARDGGDVTARRFGVERITEGPRLVDWNGGLGLQIGIGLGGVVLDPATGSVITWLPLPGRQCSVFEVLADGRTVRGTDRFGVVWEQDVVGAYERTTGNSCAQLCGSERLNATGRLLEHGSQSSLQFGKSNSGAWLTIGLGRGALELDADTGAVIRLITE